MRGLLGKKRKKMEEMQSENERSDQKGESRLHAEKKSEGAKRETHRELDRGRISC